MSGKVVDIPTWESTLPYSGKFSRLNLEKE